MGMARRSKEVLSAARGRTATRRAAREARLKSAAFTSLGKINRGVETGRPIARRKAPTVQRAKKSISGLKITRTSSRRAMLPPSLVGGKPRRRNKVLKKR